MDKQSAITLMKEGKKLTHYNFMDTEWVTIDPVTNIYYFEDGCANSEKSFWQHRANSSWHNDWSLFTEAKPDLEPQMSTHTALMLTLLNKPA